MTILRGARKATLIGTTRARCCRLAAGMLFSFISMAAGSGAFAGNLDKFVLFNIRAQTLKDALLQFATQADVKISFASGSEKDAERTRALQGVYAGKTALAALLKGTHLSYVDHGDTIEIVRNKLKLQGMSRPSAERAHPETSHPTQGVVPPGDASRADKHLESSRPASEKSPAQSGGVELQEITVTGTYIPGTEPISPVITLTHRQLAQEGYTRLDDAIQQLPQNFMGGGTSQASNTVNGAGALAAYNATFSSGVNLRGLGPGTTLVLLNGMRMAPTSIGFSTDISQIPLSIVDRVEIVPDGNSALYGSDAVGGVVNIITVKNYSGVESGLRVSDVTPGMQPNEGGHILGGESWGSGGLVANFDFEQDHPLYARNRSFTSGALDPYTLLIEQTTPSAYASLQQSFGTRWSVAAFGLWSARRFESPNQTSTSLTLTDGRAAQTSGGLQAEYAIAPEWSATLIGQYSREADAYSFVYYSPLSRTSENNDVLQERSGELRVNGSLIRLPGGPLSMALGGESRRDQYQDDTNNTQVGAHSASRTVGSAFAELVVPIVGAENSLPLIKAFRLDLAGRYDHYSDFGSSTNPKVSLDWSPTDFLSVSGSYGKSFRAPTLYSLDPTEIANAYVINAPSPSSSTGTARVLDLDGTNPRLTPETAKTLDFGLTVRQPSSHATARISYFDIEYQSRITRLVTDGYFTNVLLQAAALGPLVNLSPTPAEISAALSGRNVYSYVGPWTPQSIQAIANIGFENAASLLVRGSDLDIGYDDLETSAGRVRLNATGTYYATYRQKIAPNSTWTSLQNTVVNPLRFRAVGNLGWDRRNWGANVRLNYSNAYRDPVDLSCAKSAGCPVSSWTTLDLALSYSVPPGNGLLAGLRASISVTNLFDRDPPRVSGLGTPGIDYDPINASPLGRAFALELSKQWGSGR